MVRAKFRCQSVTTSINSYGKQLQTFKFFPVTNGSEENKRFFDSTPSGNLELGVVNPEVSFDIGSEYYLDLTKV